MIYNDVSGGQGLLQSIEFWAGLNPGDITNNIQLKKIITNLLNRRLDRYLGILGASSGKNKIDDTNYDTQPFAYFDIEQGVHSYEFLKDEDGNDISDFTAVLLLKNNRYVPLTKITLDHPEAELIMSPNTDDVGVPYRYLEKNNTIFLNPVPNYSLAKGGKVFFKRCPSYFSIDDTTKEPGIPFQFHPMLAMATAYDWVIMNKPQYQTLIITLKAELDKLEKEFMTYNELRNPERKKLTPKIENMR